jgi:hypothetical protein
MSYQSRNDQPTAPYGTCHCGCKRLTTTNAHKDPATGDVTAVPCRFIHGHNRRKTVRYVEVPTGHLTPCWMWQLAKNRKGYGMCWDPSGKTVLAHRFYYEGEHGPIPADLQLDHLCHVPGCVRPEHLEPVTAAENVRRGRATKLGADDIRWIRTSNEKQMVLARRFGVDQSHISRIKNNHTWRGMEPVGHSGDDAAASSADAPAIGLSAPQKPVVRRSHP